jgi:PAS domain S-box-containing protein
VTPDETSRDATLHTVLDSMAEAVIAADIEGRFQVFNRAAVALIGVGPSDVGPEGWPGLYGAFRPDRVTPFPFEELPLVRAIRGEGSHAVEMFIRNAGVPSGIDISVSGRPWRDRTGRHIGGVVVCRGTLDRRAAAELLKAHVFLESIVENIPDMIFVKEAKHLRFERFNRAGEELLGASRDVLIGKTDYDFFPVEQADAFTALDRQTLAGGVRVDIPEEPIDTVHGRRWLHTRKIPILDELGNPKYLLGISENITARKAAEEARAVAEEELRLAHAALEQRVLARTAELSRINVELRHEIVERERAEEALRKSEAQLLQSQKMDAVGQLAGGIAHDFNNLLAVILAYGGLLEDSLEGDEVRSAEVRQITKAAERAATLTRQLLAFTRQQVMQPAVIDLGDVVQTMEEMLRRLIGEHITLVTIRGANQGCVLADPGQMEQVVLNLTVNARDAMPGGGVLTIETRNLDAAEGGRVLLEVSDTGAGMSPETLARIFEPFFTTKRRGQGTGLGLSTVLGIVEQSGGAISVESQSGQGARFRVSLPRTQRRPTPPSGPRTGAKGGSETLLVVEDEDLLRAATREILTDRGYQVLDACDAETALRVCRTHLGRIHLLLSDVILPGMNGGALAKQAVSLRPDMRVLFMSGYTDDLVERRVLDSGEALLHKPFTPHTLASRVREMLD